MDSVVIFHSSHIGLATGSEWMNVFFAAADICMSISLCPIMTAIYIVFMKMISNTSKIDFICFTLFYLIFVIDLHICFDYVELKLKETRLETLLSAFECPSSS